MMTPLLILPQAAIGLCLGSFMATAAIRMARGEPFLGGRSHCDACGVELGFAATVPVVSYLIRRGACANCGARIDALHLVGESCGAVIVVLALNFAPLLTGLMLALLGFVLLTAALVDAATQRLPDVLTLTAAGLAAALAAQRSLVTLATGVACALLAMAVLEGVRRLHLRARGKQGLGFGDVKLVGALAIWLGLATPWAIALAAVLGLGALAIRRSASGRIAFGPALCLGAFAVGLIQEVRGWPALV